MAHFILWYGFLRIFVDFYREYRTDFYGFPPGQEFNLLMTFVGVFLLFWFYRKKRHLDDLLIFPSFSTNKYFGTVPKLWHKRLVFVLLLILPSIIPGDWTHDVPKRYGHRHPGLEYSPIYPKIDVYNETKPGPEIDNQKQISTE